MKIIEKTSASKFAVDLCVLSYNGIQASEKFIDYLQENTEHDLFHLVWIDNGSTDGTVPFLKKVISTIDNMTIIFNSENKGVIGGRNIGFEYFFKDSDSDFLMFLDNDQYGSDGWLTQHLQVIKHGYDMIGVESWQMNKTFMPVNKNNSLNQWYSYVGCGGMMIRREAAENLGAFDDQFNPAYFEDPDYSFRAYHDGYKIGWNFANRITHEAHQTLGKSQDKTKYFVKSLQRFRKKWRGYQPPCMLQQKISAFDM